MISSTLIDTILVEGPPLILAITLHEAAHGYAAKRLGDNTAYLMGRVSLNPFRHIDPVGTVLIPLLLKLSGAPFLFGYAKPVPVNFAALNNPKRDMIWVALAGPASNLIQAFLWGLIYYLGIAIFGSNEYLTSMSQAGILWNVMLGVFNLFPVPPLDGGRILTGLLPYEQANKLYNMNPYIGLAIVIGLSMAGLLGPLWMEPLMAASYFILDLLLMPVRFLLT
jgi:Zn-dependent protease